MKKAKVLILVEGEKTEQQLFAHFFNLYGEKDVEIISFKTNLYVFYHHLLKNYSVDDKIDYDAIDLPLFICEYLKLPQHEWLQSDDFIDKLLIFDFDPQDGRFSEEKIIDLMTHFSQSTDLGKLYINYPMVESVFDLNHLTKHNFATSFVTYDVLKQKIGKKNKYKVEVWNRSCIKRIREITPEVGNIILHVNNEKLSRLTNDNTDNKFINFCSLQCTALANNHRIWILNTSILHFYEEYGPILNDDHL